ncbi:hypothetical protein EGW08_018806, partial [Elysia chlorotica]
MGSPDGTKIALGLLASASALILSYILLKKYGFRASQAKLEESKNVFRESSKEEQSETTDESKDTIEPEQAKAASQEKNTAAATSGNDGGDDGGNQTSFIVLDDGHEDAPPEGGNAVRKSDKSSDESSYDVIEDDRMGEMEEEEDEDDEEEKRKAEEDENASAKPPELKSAGDSRPDLESSLETSMVVVEEAERSNIEKSNSSFYASADENFGMAHLDDSSELNKGEGDDEAENDEKVMELSMTDDITTFMYKSGTNENDTITLEEKNSANDVAPVTEEFVVAGDDAAAKYIEAQGHPDNPAMDTKLESHSLTDAVMEAGLEASSADRSQIPPGQEINSADATEVLSKCQSTPMSVTKEDIDLLVHLLRKNMPELQATVLNSIVRIAAFNQNTRNIRDSGCPEEIVYQLKTNCEAVISGETGAEALLTSICQVLTNLSMDPKAHPKLEESIPSLINLLVLDAPPEPLVLATLRPLINLSAEPTYHAYYVRAIPSLLAQLDSGSNMAKVQSLKVLVNLSLDDEVVPHILAGKAPLCLLSLLAPPTQNDVTLRAVTMLANVFTTLRAQKLGPESLPTGHNSDSAESIFTILHDAEGMLSLRSKVYRLTKNDDEDVTYQASRLYKYISDSS